MSASAPAPNRPEVRPPTRSGLGHAADYRADIDGARAIAVLSVIVFHINEQSLPGGFIGVDLFFVISGFLITRNLLAELQQRCFSVLEFYRRRVKRIVPALLVVVAATICAAQVLQLPEDAERTAESGLWSLLSLSNVYFWLHQGSGYFDPDSRELPLLNLWSLGVEEQFYLLWPLLLAFAWRSARRSLWIAAAVLVGLGSFLLGDWLFEWNRLFVYYMLPTRAGELLVGAVLAMALLRPGWERMPPAAATALGVLGLLLVAVSLWWLSGQDQFPGIRALPPTLGMALLLLSGHCARTPVARALSWQPLRWVGLVSYSAYLWHWPLLALYRYGYGEVGAFAGCCIMALTLLLAWGTYRYVEVPLRRSPAPAWRLFTTQYFVPGAALSVLALAAMYVDGFGLRRWFGNYSSALASVEAQTRPPYAYGYVCQRQRLKESDAQDARCVVGADAGPLGILWGDSHAAHYVGVLGAIARRGGFRMRNLEHGACPPVLGDVKPLIENQRSGDCMASLNVALSAVERYPVVIIAGFWSTYQRRSGNFLEQLFGTAETLARRGQRVVLMGQVPMFEGYDRRCRAKALSYPWLGCPRFTVPMMQEVAQLNARIRQFAAATHNVDYFEVTSYLCPDGVCSPIDALGKPRYFDASHLTLSTSWALGNEVIAREGVPAPFAALPQAAEAALVDVP
jgi:peptidoglycan/LPS O-acetylase OafA/YrhL